jgi:type I restriction enzyme S subunit
MVTNLKPYPSYKPSSVPWLGEVPERWGDERGKWLFRKVERPVRTEDDVVTCFRDGTVTLRKNRRVRGFTEALKEIGYQGIRRGDLVIHAMDGFAGAIGVSDSDGKGSPVYSVCTPTADVDPHFYAYLLREMARNGWILALTKGIRERSTDFRFADFGGERVPHPPHPDQSAIVRYLDHVDRRIREFIRAKQKLIALLNEQKQAIIHQAVTGQIDVRTGKPYSKYKPSGVHWLGAVPEHWQVMPIKRAFISMDYGISESATDVGTIRLLTMGHIRDGSVTVPTDGGVAAVDPALLLQRGDLLFNRTNSAELVGKVGLFRGTDAPVTFASYLVRMRPRPQNDPEYMNLLLNDRSILSVARREAVPSLHQSNLNPTRYGRLHIAIPQLSEQAAIVRFLQEATVDQDAALDRARHEIDLLREYRTRLVADVVTGKLDVREAAANLPEEAEEAEEPVTEAPEVLEEANEEALGSQGVEDQG